MILLVVGLQAKNRKADKILKEGQAAEDRGDWDRALDLYERAVDLDPSDIAYLVPMRKARFEAGQAHVKACLLYTSPSPRDRQKSRMPSSA